MTVNGAAWTWLIFWKILTKGPFLASIFWKFSTKKLLDENKPVFWGFAKLLIIRRLRRFWQKKGLVEKKKSTTFENLALTFENLACLQTREKQQNLSKKRAQKQGQCAIFRLLRPDFSSGNGSPRLENGHFSLKIASSPWAKFSVKYFDILA